MNYYLLRMKTKGMKNIDDFITINFYNETIKNKLIINGNNVKSIYGMNGAGKSAIMNSVDMYVDLVKNSNCLMSNELMYFNNIINKSTHQFVCEMIFAEYDNDKDNKINGVYKHYLEFKLCDNKYTMIEESLSVLNSNYKTINGEYDLIFKIHEGELIFNEILRTPLTEIIINKTMNLLDRTSLFSLLPEIIVKIDRNEIFSNKTNMILCENLLSALFFTNNINVFIDACDKHDNYNTNYDLMINELKISNDNQKFDEIMQKTIENRLNPDRKIIPINEYEEYVKEVKKLAGFIKNFKPSLIDIDPEKKIDGNKYLCALNFIYKNDIIVNSEFESNGIKKLIKLYNYFKKIDDGKIVFIDELDANIHDVYLTKLVEYFENYSKGQLCFTSHNLGTMTSLKKYNYSISFINEETKIVNWIKNGHYDPASQYKNGMINGAPFNIEDFDFLKIFSKE